MKSSHVILAVFGAALFIVAVYAISYITAETRGKVSMENKVASGDAQIFSYNQFFDACSAINGYTEAANAQRRLLEQVPDSDKARVLTNIGAIEAERGRAIQRYNTDSLKVKTLARFKDSGLPDFISPQKEIVSCGR